MRLNTLDRRLLEALAAVELQGLEALARHLRDGGEVTAGFGWEHSQAGRGCLGGLLFSRDDYLSLRGMPDAAEKGMRGLCEEIFVYWAAQFVEDLDTVLAPDVAQRLLEIIEMALERARSK